MNCAVLKIILYLLKIRTLFGKLNKTSKIRVFLDNHKLNHPHRVREYIEKYQDKIKLSFLPSSYFDMNP